MYTQCKANRNTALVKFQVLSFKFLDFSGFDSNLKLRYKTVR